MAAILRWLRPCFTAPACTARSVGRCRPGCAAQKAGASSPRMSASLTSRLYERAPAAEARNITRAHDALGLDEKTLNRAAVGKPDRADRQRRRHSRNKTAKAFNR